MNFDPIQAASAYIPAEWRQALARGEMLPERTIGAALFADISGFTPLTEALTETLGLRRGAEELARHLNRVYDALIAEVDRYGGSVIGFAGDAITCWFDDCRSTCQVAPQRAVACALAMQSAMRRFAAVPVPGREAVTLALKVAVASGPARRFVVGDPAIQRIPVLAGATLTRMAAAEHLAGKGEVVVDEATAAALGEPALVQEWRVDAEGRVRFAVLGGLADGVAPAPWPPLAADALREEQVRPWVLPVIYERLAGGLGEFLTELRPAAALFLRFGGIDYEGDERAGAQLDAYIRGVQGIVAASEGTLIQLTVGDKGSYLYIAFGAPISHEDDARRAVACALALLGELPTRPTCVGPAQIGIAWGTMRAGACGGAARRTYGVLGDGVNLAARLMGQAAPGEVVVSGRVQKAVATAFDFEPRPPIRLKGKAEPLPVFAVLGVRQRRAMRLQEPAYALPMVGRQAELHLIAETITQVLQGQGQIVGITGEAGLGKSRLVAEAIRLARRHGITGYGGACQSDGMNTSYLVWGQIFRALFDVDPEAPLRRQTRNLEGAVEDLAPGRVAAVPLLGTLLGLRVPDNDLTSTLEAKDRKTALEALLLDCLKAAACEARAERRGLLLVLEDLHWIDPVSHDLLEEVARAIVNLPVLVLLAYRPPELQRLQSPRVEGLQHFTLVRLGELGPEEAELAVRAKLAQLMPERSGAAPAELMARVIARAQGNPFYIEELLNYCHDRDIALHDAAALAALELPTSLHSLILSRIDQLTARQQLTIKVASVIGRLFRFSHLHGYYPALGAEPLREDLDILSALELTPLDTPEPELAYLFKHIITREVAYENLPYATRAALHEAYAQYLEGGAGLAPAHGQAQVPGQVQDLPLPLDALAYHYSLSENLPKQREYLRKAGEAAAARYANVEAIDYYERLLPLLDEPREQVDIRLKLGTVLELVGRWDDAEERYREALTLAARVVPGAAPRCYQVLGHLTMLRGDFDGALAWAEKARLGCQAFNDRPGVRLALHDIGTIVMLKGDYASAMAPLQEGLAIARALDDRAAIAAGLCHLGISAHYQGDFTAGRAFYEESLALARRIGDRRKIAVPLNNLADMAIEQGDYERAWKLHEEALALVHDTGDKWSITTSELNLGTVARCRGDRAAARALLEQSLASYRELGDKDGIANALYQLGLVDFEGNHAAARSMLEESLELFREIDNQRGLGLALNMLGNAALAQGDVVAAQSYLVESLKLALDNRDRPILAHDLAGLAAAAVSRPGQQGSAAMPEKAHCASRLAAASEKLLTEMDAAMDPAVRTVHTRTVAAARAALGDEAFAAAWAQGQAMTLDQALALALQQGDVAS